MALQTLQFHNVRIGQKSNEIVSTAGDNWTHCAMLEAPGSDAFEIEGYSSHGNFAIGIIRKECDMSKQNGRHWSGYHLTAGGQLQMYSESPAYVQVPGPWGGKVRLQFHTNPVPTLWWFSFDQESWTIVPARKGIQPDDYRPCVFLLAAQQSCRISLQKLSGKRKHNILHEAQMQKMWIQHDFADASVICQGTRFAVHRCVLSAASDVFEATFKSDMNESKTLTMTIDDGSVDAVEALLYHMYTGSVHFPSELAIDVLLLAHRYGLPNLVESCAEQVLETMDEKNVAQVIRILRLLKDDSSVLHMYDKAVKKLQENVSLLKDLMQHV